MSQPGYTKLGATVAELDTAWQDRLKDADELLTAGRNGMAIAVGLYALEIRLKVLICRRLDLERLPRAFEIHDLRGLLLLAGLSRRIERKPARGVKRNWDQVASMADKLNDFRYTADANWTASVAAEFFRQLRDLRYGVMTWLNKVR